VFKDYDKNKLIKLKNFGDLKIKEKSFSEIIVSRRSRRKYTNKAMSLEELSYLLYTNNGITAQTNERYLRAAPSGGNRHTIETYLIIQNVKGIEKGIYRYIPLENAIVFEKNIENIENITSNASRDQKWIKKSSVIFVWTTAPYKCEWRYQEKAHKLILLDAGHICQNLYLACEAIGLGTCAIAAYHQKPMDDLIGVDGNDEFVVYLAPVGSL
jgi:SagB-type dehydrogenase family enzyme